VFSLKTFRVVALTEATSFLLLLVASVLKRTSDTDLVPILGPIHGVLFVAYVLIALNLRDEQGWTMKETVLILLGAVLPFGGYAVDRWLAVRASSRSPAAP
jgi:integral membrane protein